MTFQVLDTVVLSGDIPEQGLKRGDVGAIVEVYDDDSYDIEFVSGSGHTLALVTLPRSRIQPMGPNEILSARQMSAA